MSTKKTYSIGTFAKITGVTIDTLRFYEKRSLLHPRRNGSDRRYYTSADVDRMALILRLKGGGFSIGEIQTYLVLKDQGAKTTQERSAFLKNKVGDLYTKRKQLDDSIDYVEHTITYLDQLES